MTRRVESFPPSDEMPIGRVVVHVTEDEFLGRVPLGDQSSAVVIKEDPRRTDPSFGIANENARQPYTFTGEGDDGFGNYGFRE